MSKMQIEFDFFYLVRYRFPKIKNAVNHNLIVQINPETLEIEVADSISIEGDFKKEFLLHVDGGSNLKLPKWGITGSVNSFVISYQGKIESEIEQSEENYQ